MFSIKAQSQKLLRGTEGKTTNTLITVVGRRGENRSRDLRILSRMLTTQPRLTLSMGSEESVSETYRDQWAGFNTYYSSEALRLSTLGAGPEREQMKMEKGK